MKKILFFATAAIGMLASCTTNDFVGDESILEKNEQGNGAIVFGTGVKAATRADAMGADAATKLNNNFVVFGYKTMSDESKQMVFDNYQVNFKENTNNSTTTNSAGWEYVGYKSLTADMTGNTGVSGNTTNGTVQTVKYWDYSATNYKFFAYSLGNGVTSGEPSTTTYANGSKMANSSNETYTLKGNQEQLTACYISELKTVNPTSSSEKKVELHFLSIQSKIQLGFYETIPGYSVKDLKFYTSASATAGKNPALYEASGTGTLPKAGTYTVTFDNNGKPSLAWTTDDTDGTQSNVEFSNELTEYVGKEYQEAEETAYLGRSSNAATKTSEKDVLPFATGATLTLKVDYTLLSLDGSGETIKVTGATATVPSAYTQWKPNYKYTYIFKISDNTNGTTGGEVTGLYPITFDAVVTQEQDGSQETITTVSEPSITTYAKGAVDNEYPANSNIYVIVTQSNNVKELTVNTNAKLYTVTAEDGAYQGITEASVANALEKGKANNEESPTAWTVTDANAKKLVVTSVTGLSAITQIDANDSPTGAAINVNGAKFTGTGSTTYAFEYTDTDDSNKKYYKIIKVAAAATSEP